MYILLAKPSYFSVGVALLFLGLLKREGWGSSPI